MWRKGIFRKLPVVGQIYNFAYRRLSPSGTMLFKVQGLKMYAEARTDIAQILDMIGAIEVLTTKLFLEQVKEGMTVLDIGANIGYYSLIAARRVGKKGLIFAFEPAPENLSLLRRNIEANGFNNIIPVAKAVSNCSGKQKLFLGNDPIEHSLSDYVGTEFIEVDVTSVDEFVRSQNLSVDLIKIDVDGTEMKVLEGMVETQARNPSMKIITEFVPHLLEKNGYAPKLFLERLMAYGFELHVIDEEKHRQLLTIHKKHRQELITPDNINDIIKTCRRRSFVNIFCDRNA